MYKTLGFKWLFETSCPASAFVSADSDEARNPQRFIHVNVTGKRKKRNINHLFERKQTKITFILCVKVILYNTMFFFYKKNIFHLKMKVGISGPPWVGKLQNRLGLIRVKMVLKNSIKYH